MDGLLVDSEPYWDEARQMLVVDAGLDWNWTLEDQDVVMGNSTAGWVNYLRKRFALDMSPLEVEQGVVANMLKLYRRRIPFLVGARRAVRLSATQFRVGLASGSPPGLIQTVIDDEALQGKFEVVLSGDAFAQGKPAPDIYLAAAAQLGLEPQQCVCLEDSGNGILAGKRAGMRVIAVPDERFSPAAEKLAEADVVLESLEQFSLKLVAGLG